MSSALRAARDIGAVASPHWRASDVGREVLEGGGNALDACIAMNAVLGVLYPHMSGIGGDLFLLYYDARSRQVHSLNGSGRAPLLATPSEYLRRGLSSVPMRGPLAATVPGAVHAWSCASERFGSLPLGRLLEPAIETAADGFAVTERFARWVRQNQEDLRHDPRLRGWLFDARGEAVGSGTRLVQPELADTLRRIATVGPGDFYVGSLASSIDEAVREGEGLLRYEDLASHRSDWSEPISITSGGLDVYTTPPNSQGVVALEMLNILVGWNADQLTVGSAELVDAVVRAKVIAFADRNRYVGDPAFVDIPTTMLLSEEHARKVGSRHAIHDRSAVLEGDTVYVCAIDGSHNVCSLIQSIYYAFGSAFVAGNTGVLLHNRGHSFSLDSGDVNVIAPGKRPRHTLMPALVLRDGKPWLAVGTMGADGQPQTMIQVLLRLLSGECPLKAVSAPRVLSGRFLLEDGDDRLLAEESLGSETIARLEEYGHDVDVVPELYERMGHAHAIAVGSDGRLQAASDPRSDGVAYVLTDG